MANIQPILELDAFDFNDELLSAGSENFVFHNINVSPILDNAGLNSNSNVTRNHDLFNKPPLLCDPKFDNDRKTEWNQHKQTSPQYQSLQEESLRLPIYAERILDRVIEKLEKKPSCIIFLNGIPASGKTTQLPQALLNHAIENDRASQTYILVALPTNLAVWALAQRVAQERGEKVGLEVGYKISGDEVLPQKRGSILFLTYNTLRLWLERNTDMNNVSHLILDEVDERDKNTDKCLRLVKLNKIPQKLKVIDISTRGYYRNIQSYFSGFETFAFDIRVDEPELNIHYLAEVIEVLNLNIPERYQISILDFKRRQTSFHCPEIIIDPRIIDALEATDCYSAETITTMRDWDLTKYPGLEMDLITHLASHLCQQMDADNIPRGNILIYMVEYEAIKQISSRIERLPGNIFKNYDVIFMHAKMDMKYLQQIFEPSQKRKIIIASNIAETSITIPGVCHVIDCGMTKMQIFDPKKNIENFQPHLSARSNAMNRARAAGRTPSRKGDVYRIYTKNTFTDIMSEYHKPELARISLSTELLELKLTNIIPMNYFRSLPTRPEQDTLNLAARDLVEIDLAVTDHPGPLTDLGRLASKLVSTAGDLRYAKMLIMGVVMCCVEPIVTIVAFLSLKDPFRILLDKGVDRSNRQTVSVESDKVEAQIRFFRKQFAEGSHSDHIMFLNVMDEFLSQDSAQIQSLWARNYYIDYEIMKKIVKKKSNLILGLKNARILPHNYPDNQSRFDENSENKAIIRAVTCRSFKIARLRYNKRYEIITHSGRSDAHIQQGSVNHCCFQSPNDCDCDNSHCHYLLYDHAYFTEATTILCETTAVGPLTLMLFGATNLTYNQENHFLQADGFRFHCDERKAQQIIEAKRSLEEFIQHQIGHLVRNENISHQWGHFGTVFLRISDENDWICSPKDDA